MQFPSTSLPQYMQRWYFWPTLIITTIVVAELVVAVMDIYQHGMLTLDFMATGLFAATLGSLLNFTLINHLLTTYTQYTQAQTDEAQNRLKMASEAAQLAFWELDFTTGKLNFDALDHAQFGANSDLHNLASWLGHIHPEDVARFERAFHLAAQDTQGIIEVEYRFKLSDAGWNWMQIRGQITQRTADGKPMFATGGSLNIQSRKLAELKLAEANQRLQHIFNENPDVMLISRLQDGKITHVNQSFVRTTGHSAAESIGNTTVALQLWSNPVARDQMVKDLLSQGSCHHLEATFQMKDGTLLEGELEGVITQLNGEPHALTTIRDISARKQTALRLQQSEALLRTTLASTDEGILITTLNNDVLSKNARFLELWQVPDALAQSEDEQGLLASVLDQLSDPAAFLARVQQLYASQAESRDELHFKDGRVFARYSRPLVIEGKQGRIWCFKDITDSFNIQRQLNEVNSNLEMTLLAIPDLMFELDEQGTYLNIFAKNETLLAAQKSLLLGHTVREMLPPLEADTVMAALRIAERDGYSHGEVIKLNLPSGESWFELSTAVKPCQDACKHFIMLSRDITERKQIENELKQSNQRFRNLFDSSPDPIWIIDQHRFAECNQAAVDMLGYPDKESLRDTHPSELSPPFQPDGESSFSKAERMMQLAQEQGINRFEWVHLRKDGSEFIAEVTLSSIAFQTRPAIYCVWRDITERKRIEQTLAKSEDRLHLALASAQMGVWEYNFQMDQLYWSPEIYQLFELPECPPSREALLQMVHSEDAPLIQSTMERAIREHTPYFIEYRLMAHGRVQWVEDRGEIQYDSDGHPRKITGTAQNITQRKQAALALQQESEKNRALLRNASDGIHILNFDGFVVEASDSFGRMLGYTRDEIIGMHVSRWDAKFQGDALMAVVRQQFSSTERQQFETQHRRKDGSIFDVEVSGFPLDLAGQRVLFNSSRDITERKAAEHALQDSELRAKNLAHLLRLVSDNVPDLIWAKDLNKRFLFTNKAMCEQLLNANDTDEPVGKDDLFFAQRERNHHPDNPQWHTFGELCQDSDVITLQNGKPSQFDEFGNVRGQFLFLDVRKAPIINDQGEIIGVVGSARDVTQQRTNEEKLHLAALILENSSEAMLLCDANNHILEINPAFTKLTGYTLDEVYGKTPAILHSDQHPSSFYQAMWAQLLSTGVWQGEIWNRRKNGEIYAEWLTINTIRHPDGDIHRYVALFSDITERKKVEERIWAHANFDQLTQLPNRRMFYDRLAHDLVKAHRTGQGLALMFLDLDRFKEINDTLGHDIGDALLVMAAQRIASCVRESDTVARLGGDEFTILLTDLREPNCVERIAEAILHTLSQPFTLGNDIGYVSASIGITLYPEDGNDLETLLKNADQAMYVAKNAGRNRFSYFTSAMQQAAQHRLHLLNDLRQALKEGQLRLYYQPIVDLNNGKIHKAEALLRWFHPKRGLINPAEFIPLAEDSGLIHEIGNWLFRESIRQAKIWRARFGADFQISVNKSPIQIQNRNNEQQWFKDLESAELSGSNIVFEITEGLLLDTSPTVVSELIAYRDAGIQVAIDDFGTGYSSLSYLKKMDIDYIKIDQSFIQMLTPDPSDLALTQAIVVMAHKLDLKVIAEGVETAEQHHLLQQMGCDYAQGYLFAKPLTATEFEQLLQQPPPTID